MEKVGLGENGSVAEEHVELGCWMGKVFPRLWRVCRALSSVSLIDHPAMHSPSLFLIKLSPVWMLPWT